MAATTTRRKTVSKPAPEPEVVEDEFEDMEDDDTEETTEVEDDDEATDEDDLEELDEDEEPATPTKATKAKTPAKTAAPKQPAIEFGSPWLAAYITEQTGDTYDARGIRMLLRKLAKDGKLNRVVGEDRGRYSFSGPTDPIVVEVITMVKSGAAKELKQAGLEKVKADAAAKKAAAKAAAEAEAEDMEEVEDETPKPTRRKAPAPAKATPAKATPATATRRKAPATTAK